MQTLRARVYHLFVLFAGFLEGCATGPVNPSFPVTATQANQAIAQMRRAPLPLRRPLVIVGGFLDPNLSPPWYAHFFGELADGQTIIPVSVGYCTSFEQCRQRVIDAVDRALPSADPLWTSEVDVVGASLGGLVARYAAAPPDDPDHPRRLKIARLFSISSPHSGARLALTIAPSDYIRQMRPGSPFLQTLAKSDAAAGYEIYPYVHLDDEVVGDRYAAPPGRNVYWLANDVMLPPHVSAMIDARILADIARRLRGQTPFTLAPPAPLPDAISLADTRH
jgi:hypothetical protein